MWLFLWNITLSSYRTSKLKQRVVIAVHSEFKI